MTTVTDTRVRKTAVYDLTPGGASRGQNFFVQWATKASPVEAHSDREMLLLLPDDGALVHTDSGETRLAGRTVCVLPAGRVRVCPEGAGPAVLIASSRSDLAEALIGNQADYDEPDRRIVPSESGYRRTTGTGAIQVMDVDAVVPPAGKPRLKMFQTETLGINWVEYHEARDRTQLSPHSHGDFEQGSLAIDGHFVHHLRVQWGANANEWRDDEHLQAGPASMITVPVNLIHTTEGVGAGRHLLIDVFSPPRHDFISKGWVSNAQDYTREALEPAAAST
jgi:mannose-6-phosphate isomerase-like protein (cupin superfamily)